MLTAFTERDRYPLLRASPLIQDIFHARRGGGGQPKTSEQSISWTPLNSQAQKMPPPFEFVNQINKRQQAGRTGDAA